MSLYNFKTRLYIALLLEFFSMSLVVGQVKTQELNWEKSSYGKSVNTPEPWTPLNVVDTKDNININCWNRTYIFPKKSILPSQIINSKKDLLYSQIKISLYENNQKLIITPTEPRISFNSPIKIKLVQNGKVDNKIDLSLTYTIEYDGLVLCNIKIDNPEELNIDSIKIDIPIDENISLYEQRYQNNKAGIVWKNGSLNPMKGIIDNTSFIPYIWIGNNHLGLFWFCETPIGWPNWRDKNAIQLIRGDNNVILRINLVSKPNKIKHLDYTFGIQATPVKPFPKDWRSWRLTPAINSNIAIIWSNTDPSSTKYFGYPEATNQSLYDSVIRRLHNHGLKAVPYFCLTAISTKSPEWQKYKSTWGINYKLGTNDTNPSKKEFIARVDPTQSAFQNFITYKFYNFIKSSNLDGAYLDLSNVIDINDRKATHTSQGLPFFPILATRELYKRFYILSKGINPNFIIIGHTSKNIYIPVLSFVDAYMDGEQFGSKKYKVQNSYSQVISLDQFRSEFMGKQFGIIPIFLPKFSRESSKLIAPTRGLLGLLLLHDVIPWAQWCNVDVVNKMYKNISKFPIGNSKFIGYYCKTPPANTNMKNAYISAYANPNNMLLVIANIGSTSQKGFIKLRDEYLNTHEYIVKDLESDAILSKNTSEFNIGLEAQSYKLIEISFLN